MKSCVHLNYVNLPKLKYTVFERKFDVEFKYALNYHAWVKAEMFWLNNVLNCSIVETYFGAPCIQRLTHNFELFFL